MTLTEKAAYLKGLAEGMNLSESNNDKLIKAIIETIDEITLSIEDIEVDLDELEARVEEIDEDLAEVEDLVEELDEDLGMVEEDIYGDECCDDDCDCCEDDCDCCCDDDDCCCDEDAFFEVTCPSCNETICIDADSLDTDSMICPSCGIELEFDFEDEDEEQIEE